MKNPYFELHGEFKKQGARLLLSSGQACVLFGIAAFSKDGDWIIDETQETSSAILSVLSDKKAQYRMGAPLDTRWLAGGWSSHFEFVNEKGVRIRTDFVSRPPRVTDIRGLWARALEKNDIDVVDVENLILIKETRRQRDYSVIGSIADVCGFNENNADIALRFLQDYDLLKKAVDRWPENARLSSRPAVKLLVSGQPRTKVVAALAIEQDQLVVADKLRMDKYRAKSKEYDVRFMEAKTEWSKSSISLMQQHSRIVEIAEEFLPGEI